MVGGVVVVVVVMVRWRRVWEEEGRVGERKLDLFDLLFAGAAKVVWLGPFWAFLARAAQKHARWKIETKRILAKNDPGASLGPPS